MSQLTQPFSSRNAILALSLLHLRQRLLRLREQACAVCATGQDRPQPRSCGIARVRGRGDVKMTGNRCTSQVRERAYAARRLPARGPRRAKPVPTRVSNRIRLHRLFRVAKSRPRLPVGLAQKLWNSASFGAPPAVLLPRRAQKPKSRQPRHPPSGVRPHGRAGSTLARDPQHPPSSSILRGAAGATCS